MEETQPSVVFEGKNLQGIQLGVNNGHITFNLPSPNATTSATSQPNELGPVFLIPYAENKSFVGRTELLRNLQELLFKDDSPTRVALFGLGGIGKTQIALQYAYWVQHELGDVSVFWVHAASAEQFEKAYTAIAKECQIPGHDNRAANMLELVKDWLERKYRGRWLMVIDNADDRELFFGYQDESMDGDITKAEFSSSQPAEPGPRHFFSKLWPGSRGKGAETDVLTTGNPSESPLARRDSFAVAGSSYHGNLGRYLPDCSHGTILVTTKDKQTGSRLVKGGPLLAIREMTEDETTELLCKHAPFRDATPSELSLLASRLDYLPLALAQAAAFIENNDHLTISEYAALLEKDKESCVALLGQNFEAPGRDAGNPHAVARTWVLSFEQVQKRNRLAGELLSVMTFFDRQAVPLEFLSSYQGKFCHDTGPTKEIELTKALGVLTSFSLVVKGKDQRFNTHRLVHLVTRRWLQKKGMVQQFADSAFVVVSDAYAARPCRKFENAAIGREYHPHALSVVREQEELVNSLQLPTASSIFELKSHMDKLNRIRDELAKKQLAMASLLANIAGLFELKGHWHTVARLQTDAMEMREDVLGRKHEHTLKSMHAIARSHYHRGQLDEAESQLIRVIATSKKIAEDEYPNAMLLGTTTLALVWGERGRWKETEQIQTQLLEISRKAQGERHLNTLHRMADLAATYYSGKKWKDAMLLGAQVLEGYNTELGTHHPWTEIAMGCLVRTCVDSEAPADSEEFRLAMAQLKKYPHAPEAVGPSQGADTGVPGPEEGGSEGDKAEEGNGGQADEGKGGPGAPGDGPPEITSFFRRLLEESIEWHAPLGQWEDAEPSQAQPPKVSKERNDTEKVADSQRRNEEPFDLRRRCDDLRRQVLELARPSTSLPMFGLGRWKASD
ncbi:hypothetical protein B0I37DRAFT_196979 [Chaetomium sp. MPI-CAGE-AT-0009]|nr:hypothetical protein B0I37DRAFT_196979 [Chaetomium sp. MPI-CAGE-AT-0009]